METKYSDKTQAMIDNLDKQILKMMWLNKSRIENQMMSTASPSLVPFTYEDLQKAELMISECPITKALMQEKAKVLMFETKSIWLVEQPMSMRSAVLLTDIA
jgi:hypothetical protein